MNKWCRSAATVAEAIGPAGPPVVGTDGRAHATTVRSLRLLPAVGLVLAGSAVMARPAAADSGVPYTDPNAVGYIGLCDQEGQQITSGNITTTPFAWRAVSSVPAPAPYNNAWRTAILLAYQPQQGLTPSEWSGDELTASSRYTNPANPMVAATDGDDSLQDFIEEFHPKWDGYLQLRIYLGTENAETYSVHYPALDIHVSGDTWSAVGGGAVNCNSGTSTSLESVVLPAMSTTTTLSGAGSTASASTSNGSKPGGGGTQASGGAASGAHTQAAGGSNGARAASADPAAADVSDASHRSNALLIVGVIAALVVALAAFALIVARRRHAVSLSPDSGTP
jgi:hypothetical protein